MQDQTKRLNHPSKQINLQQQQQKECSFLNLSHCFNIQPKFQHYFYQFHTSSNTLHLNRVTLLRPIFEIYFVFNF